MVMVICMSTYVDNGSYVLYIHPDWNENWEGKIKIVDAVDQQYRDGIFCETKSFYLDESYS